MTLTLTVTLTPSESNEQSQLLTLASGTKRDREFHVVHGARVRVRVQAYPHGIYPPCICGARLGFRPSPLWYVVLARPHAKRAESYHRGEGQGLYAWGGICHAQSSTSTEFYHRGEG